MILSLLLVAQVITAPSGIGIGSGGCTLPTNPTNFSPINGATNRPLNQTVSWSGNGTSYDVYFGTNSNPPLIGNQAGTTYNPGALAQGATYFWRIASKNACGTTFGPVVSFSTCFTPIGPINPVPSAGATGIAVNPTLSWTSNGANYDVYLDTVNPPVTVVSSAQVPSSYAASGLMNNTTYYWKVVARTTCGTNSSNVWSFTTINSGSPPGTVVDLQPTSGASGISINPTLMWSSANATLFDVKFDTVNPPVAQVSTGQVGTSYVTPTLANSTTYYWQISAHNAFGTTNGAVWNFTTASGSGLPLVQTSNIVYQYSFRFDSIGSMGYSVWGGIAYNPNGNPSPQAGETTGSIHVNNDNSQMGFEFAIPAAPACAPGCSTLSQLPKARLIQSGDPSEGPPGASCASNPPLNICLIDPGGPMNLTAAGRKLGRPFVAGGKLWEFGFLYYETVAQNVALYNRNLNLSTPSFSGFGAIAPANDALKNAGWLLSVPPAWQSALGGPYLSGQCCSGPISLQNVGPSAFSLDLAAFTPYPAPYWNTSGTPLAATKLLAYDHGTHPTLGDWDIATSTSSYGGPTAIAGANIPVGWGSIIFWGKGGQGYAPANAAPFTGQVSGTNGAPAGQYNTWCYGAANARNPPIPVDVSQLGSVDYNGSSISTDATGTLITFPNVQFNVGGATVGNDVWLSDQTTPNDDGIHPAIANIDSIGDNAGACNNGATGPSSTTCVHVVRALPANLTNQHGKIGETNCYDPLILTKSPHGYPYFYYRWIYNLNDLAAVKAGTKNYWEPVPYQIDRFTFPVTTTVGSYGIGGVAQDDSGNRVFVTQNTVDTDTGAPVVHVFKIQ
jgi:hypothetical protein